VVGWLVSWAVLTTQAWLLGFTVCMLKIYVYTILRIIIIIIIIIVVVVVVVVTTTTFTIITIMHLCSSQNTV
jgi:hypothetical protein